MKSYLGTKMKTLVAWLVKLGPKLVTSMVCTSFFCKSRAYLSSCPSGTLILRSLLNFNAKLVLSNSVASSWPLQSE
eukprot:01073.XXX_165_392_1 [CDS] Oithona nana genome sequencing.